MAEEKERLKKNGWERIKLIGTEKERAKQFYKLMTTGETYSNDFEKNIIYYKKEDSTMTEGKGEMWILEWYDDENLGKELYVLDIDDSICPMPIRVIEFEKHKKAIEQTQRDEFKLIWDKWNEMNLAICTFEEFLHKRKKELLGEKND